MPPVTQLLQLLIHQNSMHVASFFLSILIITFSVFWWNPRKAAAAAASEKSFRQIPSPRGLPVIGNLHQLGALPHRSLRALAAKHGPVMLLHLGRVPAVIVSSAPAAQQVMKTNDLAFASRPETRIPKALLYDSDIGFSPYGEYWRQDMFAAGTDTTYTTIDWAMAELIKHPKVMEKAQEEVRRVVGSSRDIKEELLEGMHYLKDVIKEALRLHTPVPLLLPRETIEDTQLEGFDIPAKTRVMINAWAIGRDPKLWERAEEFWPERFANSPIDFRGQYFELVPFGSGRRGCPGVNFAMFVAELVLANLLYHFDWELPHGMKKELLDMSEASGLAVHRKECLILVPKPRTVIGEALH